MSLTLWYLTKYGLVKSINYIVLRLKHLHFILFLTHREYIKPDGRNLSRLVTLESQVELTARNSGQ